MITLTKQQKEQLVETMQQYMADELHIEMGQFDTVFLFDFITEKLGPHFYNQGLLDAQTIIRRQVDTIADAVDEQTLPVD
ncbi:DUF2164 domain-containing protein [Thalassotalea euphylliae]|uniref:DUF2164 domain-containing protein n=1 Tax=Thalassotalea euphylliae TaxID=1655234 RepID=UPI003625E766